MAPPVDTYLDLDSVERAAEGRLDRAAQPRLFDRLAWFRLIEAYCPPPGQLLALRAGDGSSEDWLFLAAEGRRAAAFAAWYSLRVDLVGARHAGNAAAMARALRKAGISSLSLGPVEHVEPLRRGLEQAGWKIFVTPRTANWRVALRGRDFAAYWADRPGKLRSTARRRAREAALDIAIDDRFDPAAWADYEAVYRASWKPEEGSFPFLRALAEQEGAAGALRLGIARRGGVPVAAQYWTVEGGEAIIHKLAYAESAKSLSPGTLLGEAMFRHVIDQDRVECIDYGTGDEAYKADWMEERRTLWQVDAFDPRRPGGLLGLARRTASNLAERVRSR